MQCPVLAHVAVFHPHLRVVGRQRELHLRILHEHRRMRFHLVVHNRPLVRHAVLHRQCRRNHLPARTVVVELTARQRQDSHLQAVQLLIHDARMCPQCQSELRVHVVELHAPVLVGRTFHHQLDGTVTQQPDADVHQEQVILHQLAHFLHARLLQHEVQLLRFLPRRYEHPVVLRQFRVHPQAVAHHVHIRNLLQRLRGTDVHVAARNQRAQSLRRPFHDFLIQRQLQRQQVLCDALSACPAEHRYRRQYLARRCIARQTAALSPCMQQDTLLPCQPVAQCGILILFLPASIQQPGRTTSRTQFLSHRIRCAEPLLVVRVHNIVKTFHQIWWQ